MTEQKKEFQLPHGASDKCIVTVVGGGNSAHVLTAFLAARDDVVVNLLSTHADEAERWRTNLAAAGGSMVLTTEDGKFEGKPNIVTNQPADVIPDSDVIVIAVPAFAHEMYLRALEPHIKVEKHVVLGTLMAYASFDLLAHKVLGETMNDMVVWGLEMLPWACRLDEYGVRVHAATKKRCDIAAMPPSETEYAMHICQTFIHALPVLKPVSNFLTLTLMNINSVWHPTITYARYRNWDGKPFTDPPLFYEGVDAFCGEKLTKIGDEIMQIKDIFESKHGVDLSDVIHVFDWIKSAYEGDIGDDSTVDRAIATNRAYKGLTHPMIKTDDGYMPDFNYRYLREDIPYGLMATRGLASLVGLPTPTIDEVIEFGQSKLGKVFLANGELVGDHVGETRAPQAFGVHDVNEFLELCHLKK